MASVRDKKGNIVRGSGSELTEKQQSFMDRIHEEGIENAGKIATDIGYTNYYRDRRTQGTAFYREIMKFVDLEAKSIEAAKGTNISKLIAIRDTAMVNGDMKMAMDAIKILNDMQGYKAPVKVEQTKLDITATIDLTKKIDEEQGYIDIDAD